MWGSWSVVRFLVVQHVSVAGSGALRPGAGRVKCLAGAVHVLRLRAGCMRGAETRESGAAVDSLPGWKRSLIERMAGVGWQRAGVRSRERTSGTWHAPQKGSAPTPRE